MTVFELAAKLILDTSSYEKSLKDSKNKLKTLGTDVSKFGSGLSKIGNSLTNSITKPALAAGTAVGAMFLIPGWNRMTKIDDARAKLKGLGHSANEVTDIMDAALKAVKGTSYGLDEAATTAASAVAAGIKDSSDLTKYLTSVADLAAIAGTGMADMGSIFNKVATSGKAQNDVLAQLSDRGIPIIQWLSEEIGVANEEVYEMAKDGEINLATFRSAVEKHVSGAAQAMGNETVTGAFKNVMAAVSRVGANFLGAADDANSFAGQLRVVFIKIQDWLGGLEDKAKDWGKVFGEVFGAFVEWVETGTVSMDKMSNSAQSIWNALEPTLNAMRTVATTLGNIWNSMSDSQRAAVIEVGAFTVALGPLLSALGSVISSVGGLIQILSVLKKAFTAGAAAKAAKDIATVATATKAASGSTITFGQAYAAALKSMGAFAAEAGILGATLEGSVISGIVLASYKAQQFFETLKGGNGAISTIGTALHSMQDELVATGKLSNEQSAALFKNVEAWESAGDTSEVMAQKFVMSLRQMGISADDARSVLNGLAAQDAITADSFGVLNSKMVLLSNQTTDTSHANQRVVTSFNELKEAVSQTAINMGLTEYQVGSLMESMSEGDGSAEALAVAYNSLMEATAACGVETQAFANELGITVPGAIDVAKKSMESTGSSTSKMTTLFKNLSSTLKNIWSSGKQILNDIVNSVDYSFKTANNRATAQTGEMSRGITGKMNETQRSVKSSMNSITSAIAGGFNSASSSVKSSLSGMQSSVNSGMAGIVSKVTSSMSSMSSTISQTMSSVGTLISNGLNSSQSSASTAATNLVAKIAKPFRDLNSQFTGWGKDLVANITRGINDTSVGRNLEQSLKNLADKIKSYLHFSVPDVGPLSDFDTYAPDMMKLFAQGIRENEHLVTDQIEKSFDFRDSMSGFGETTTTGRGGITQYINITSPKTLDAIESARLIRNSTRDMMLSINGI